MLVAPSRPAPCNWSISEIPRFPKGESENRSDNCPVRTYNQSDACPVGDSRCPVSADTANGLRLVLPLRHDGYNAHQIWLKVPYRPSPAAGRRAT